MDNYFASSLIPSLRQAAQGVAMAPMAREQAQLAAGLQSAQAAKLGTEAQEGARQAALRYNPDFLRQIDALFPGASVLYRAGGTPDKLAGNMLDLQKLDLNRQAANAIPESSTGLDRQNRLVSVSSGKTYEPYAAIGETGAVVNKGTGGIDISNPAMAALFRRESSATAGLKEAQARDAGKKWDSERGGVVDLAANTFSPAKAVGGGTLPQSNTAFSKAYDENKAKDLVEADDTIRKAGMQVPKTLGQLAQMEQLVGNYEGGKLTGMAMTAASIGNSLGLKIDPKLGDKQAAEALFNEFSLKLKNAGGTNNMPGALSDRDLAFLQATAPQLTQTASGRRLIIDSFRKLAERDQQVAKMAAEYKRRNAGRLDDGFFERLAEWSDRNSLFGGPSNGNP
ncbi:hypothetical protein C0J09_10910 [Bordetella avium]|uniref:hypothetical protein n=1 Tax=Bordetella avium TaxID=521 RepID=UPI000FDA6F9E|nr:hypothetical protein [Bordetella avium]AZY49589.1 hypothetical protein C0J09_10910 [Bordetella avium]